VRGPREASPWRSSELQTLGAAAQLLQQGDAGVKARGTARPSKELVARELQPAST